jgi:hypothetical protein
VDGVEGGGADATLFNPGQNGHTEHKDAACKARWCSWGKAPKNAGACSHIAQPRATWPYQVLGCSMHSMQIWAVQLGQGAKKMQGPAATLLNPGQNSHTECKDGGSKACNDTLCSSGQDSQTKHEHSAWGPSHVTRPRATRRH